MNILDYGARNGEFCGDAIQRAIDAAAAQGGGRVVVPAGEYGTASLVLRSNVELHLQAGAVLRFTDDFDAYPILHIRWGAMSSRAIVRSFTRKTKKMLR